MRRYGLARAMAGLVGVGLFILSPSPLGAREPDLLGVYFDPAGTLTNHTTTEPNEQVTVYLILTNPSEPTGIAGWECSLDFLSDGPAPSTVWEISGDGVNVDTPPQFSVGLAPPLPWQQEVLLASGIMVVPSADHEIAVYLHSYDPPSLHDPPVWGYPVYAPLYAAGADPSQLIPLGWASGCEGDAVAIINDDGVGHSSTLDYSPETFDFGWVENWQAVETEILIANNTPVTLSCFLEIVGDDYALRIGDGPYADHGQIQLLAGYERSITVRFQPQTEGAFPGELILRQCDQITGTVALTGYGGGPDCLVTPEILDFGTLAVADVAELSFSVTNVGGGFLNGFVGQCLNAFEVVSGNGPFHLAAGESHTVVVQFAPLTAGQHACTVNVTAPGCSPVQCVGTGESWPADCVIDPPSLDFGQVPVGQWQERLFWIRNEGGEEITGVVPGSCGDFQVVLGAGAFTLLPTQSRPVRVRFAPPNAGDYQCALNLGNEVCEEVPCTGSGYHDPPECAIDPPDLQFGEVPLGGYAEGEYTITNTGGDTLSGYVPEVCGDFQSVVGAGAFSLLGNQSHLVRVRFAPTFLGEHTCLFEVTDLCDPIPCHGFGVDTAISCTLSSDYLGFGSLYPGQTATGSFTITNTGTEPLGGQVSADCQAFQIADGGGFFNLAPDQQHAVVIIFSPPAVGSYSCLVSTGNPDCGEVLCEGNGAELPGDLDILGIYFDEEATTSTISMTVGEILPAYLCIINASVPAGVSGWECLITQTEGYFVLDWNLQGPAVNAAAPPAFAVGLAGPLPWQPAIVLMEMSVGVFTEGVCEFFIHPIANPSLPGVPAYAAGDDPGNLVPLNWSSGAEEYPVAIINAEYPIGTAAQPPSAQVQSGSIFLSWHYDPDLADGCHLFRREAEEPEAVRLTDQPLTGWSGRVEFTDSAQGISPATVLRYSIGLMRYGVEIGRSPETTITFTGSLPATLNLYPNYPNPFNPTTTIRFELAQPGHARLAIFDLTGRKVCALVDTRLPGAAHERVWNGRDESGHPVPSGTYYYRLQSAGRTLMRKMTLLK